MTPPITPPGFMGYGQNCAPQLPYLTHAVRDTLAAECALGPMPQRLAPGGPQF